MWVLHKLLYGAILLGLAISAYVLATSVSFGEVAYSSALKSAAYSPSLNASYVYVSPTEGNDTCTTSVGPTPWPAPTHTCKTLQRAYDISTSNGTVAVKPGIFPSTNINANSIGIEGINTSLAAPVTFICADGNIPDTVNFSNQHGWNFSLRNTAWVTFTGRCFHFRVLHINYPGDTGLGSDHIVIDGTHVDSFQFPGTHNVVFSNNDVGPALSCYQANEGNAAGRCNNPNIPDPWKEVAAYWSTSSKTGSTGEQMEPYIHDRGNGSDTRACSSNVTITGNLFHDMQSTDSNVMHQGGLLVDGGACQSWNHNLVVTGNHWRHNMTYGVELDGAMTGTLWKDNWFGRGYGALGTGGVFSGGQDTPLGSGLESGCRGGVHRMVDQTLESNSSDGYITLNGNGDAPGSCWSNDVIRSNYFSDSVFSNIPCGGWNSSYTGITMDSNKVFDRVCGTNGTSIAVRATEPPFTLGGTDTTPTTTATTTTATTTTATPVEFPQCQTVTIAWNYGYAALQKASIYTNWRKQNPGEATRFDQSISGPVSTWPLQGPAMTTQFGAHLVAGVNMEARACHGS